MWTGGILDEYSTKDFLKVNVEGRRGHQKLNVVGEGEVGGVENNSWPAIPCSF